jgi:hypothetical protein
LLSEDQSVGQFRQTLYDQYRKLSIQSIAEKPPGVAPEGAPRANGTVAKLREKTLPVNLLPTKTRGHGTNNQELGAGLMGRIHNHTVLIPHILRAPRFDRRAARGFDDVLKLDGGV